MSYLKILFDPVDNHCYDNNKLSKYGPDFDKNDVGNRLRKDAIMTIMFDKLILLAACTLLMLHRTPQTGLLQVSGFLAAVIFSFGCSCCNQDARPFQEIPPFFRFVLAGLCLFLSLCAAANPIFGIFLPLLFYEIASSFPKTAHYILYPAICLLAVFSFREEPPRYPALTFVLFAIALILSYKTKRLLQLEGDFRLLRDTSTEYHLLLQQKNKDLIDRQDYEIHAAALRERNRIAREIHDNVGHMLSRSILQAGALLAINQQENLKEHLGALKDTLSLAMDEIRNSTHDLHDDSIDLRQAVSDMLSEFSGYQVHLSYDISGFVPAPVKYCFIAIIKESLSNITRHSNATEVSVTLQGHPSLYRLTVADNGTDIQQAPSGIGILNMQERVKNLNGHFSVSTDKGFVVFASVPRTQNPQERNFDYD